MVVAFHAGLPVPGGFVGVDVFFVISGFVITGMLLREWAATGRIRFARFYRRRFTRLTPALALMITVTMILTAVVISPLGPQENAAFTAIGAMFLSANIVIANVTGGYFSVLAETNPLLNVWSLSVEEQFYLGFPFVLVLGWVVARGRPARRFVPVAVVLAVLAGSFLLALVDEGGLAFPGSQDALGFYSPVPRAWEFAIGAAAALVLAHRRVVAPRVALLSGLAGVVGLAASLFLITEATPFPGVWTLLPTLSTLLLIVAGWLSGDNIVTRSLETRPMVRIGDWSYSIYLWHWPFIVLATAMWPGVWWVPLAAAIASLVAAILSYRFVEEPLRTRRYDRRALLVLCAAVVAPPLLAAAFVLVGNATAYGNPLIRAYQDASRPHIGTSCGDAGGEAGATISCSFHDEARGAPVYLVGDSHADHVSDGVVGAAESTDRPVWARIAPGCQFFAGAIGSVGQEPLRRCGEYFASTMAWLTEAEPGTVVISTAAKPYWDAAIQLGPDEASMSTSEREKLAYLQRELTQSVSALIAADHSVILVDDVPTFVDPFPYAPTECSLPPLLAGDCDQVLPWEVAVAQQEGVREALDTVASTTGATIIDLRPRVCGEDGCPSRRDDLVVYSDAGHISAAQSRLLIGDFAALLSR
jgi:peptidoglycan/LPS O-acetylase OafA/YrhL